MLTWLPEVGVGWVGRVGGHERNGGQGRIPILFSHGRVGV